MKTKQYPVNKKGRDFVVGDLHGCRNLFDAALVDIDFDVKKDRMFSVGDLGDRGPNSAACMDLMHQHWFHAVRSNHGDLMTSFYDGEALGVYNFVRNGGQWFAELDDATMEKYVKMDKSLPYILTVKMKDGRKFHVIHAEFSTHVPLTDEILASKDTEFIRKVDAAAFEQNMDGPLVTWGRYIFRQFFIKDPPLDFYYPEEHLAFFNDKLSHIYSGHTVMNMPTRYLGQTDIDTGAVFCVGEPKLGLTITEPLTDRFWKTNTEGTKEVNVVIV